MEEHAIQGCREGPSLLASRLNGMGKGDGDRNGMGREFDIGG
jgi:hypothetical protein